MEADCLDSYLALSFTTCVTFRKQPDLSVRVVSASLNGGAKQRLLHGVWEVLPVASATSHTVSTQNSACHGIGFYHHQHWLVIKSEEKEQVQACRHMRKSVQGAQWGLPVLPKEDVLPVRGRGETRTGR